ncbi:biotin/lipoyl-binding protein [Bradyrhizobium barranii subsp. apii]|uniref:HlyD family secretion protein n=1 Tax=Bradyrhizobium barranii TaxID=2992140 RepID=UPI001CD7C7E0|nr:biotin/lipoyl-binding protein [Bradyrhizobium barranii]UPT95729.1 biotin/lipoyl-binding protein [Bradyrhizobium barranii subsp. apii]
MTRGRRVGLAAAIALALFVAYEVISSFVAFTDDAYVQSDLVALAPQVTGRIIAVHIADNQDVAEGDLLASIDPVPFQLALDQRRADLAEARAQIASDQHRIASARDALAAASSAADFASENEKRLTTLASAQDVSRVALDQASDTLRRANAARDAAQESVAATEATLSMHQASHARANSALALAEWQLARTKLVAPTSGTVTSLSLRVGDTAQADVPLIGIVDARAWRRRRQLQGKLHPRLCRRQHGLGVAGLKSLASTPCQGDRHCSWHQPRTRAQSPPQLRGADH